jgi:hypothetical protein
VRGGEQEAAGEGKNTSPTELAMCLGQAGICARRGGGVHGAAADVSLILLMSFCIM